MRTAFFVIIVAVALLIASISHAQDCAEKVTLTTFDGTIVVTHLEALYNCCCTVDCEVLQEDFWIDVHEYEHLIGGGCDCLCCSDVEVEIAGLAPGDYTVSVTKHSECGGVEPVGVWQIAVTGSCAPAVRTSYCSCGETGASDGETTWGVIKALYR